MRTTHAIWKTADGRLVPAGDPAAAFLLVPAGSEVAAEVALMFSGTDESDDAKELHGRSDKELHGHEDKAS